MFRSNRGFFLCLCITADGTRYRRYSVFYQSYLSESFAIVVVGGFFHVCFVVFANVTFPKRICYGKMIM